MSLAYYFDHHVPAAIRDGLRSKGIAVLTTEEDGAGRWSDERILERAAELGRLVFTQDCDFLAIAHQWMADGRPFPGVVYGHQLQVTIGGAIHDLELIAAVMAAHEMQSRVEYLPLR